MSRGRSISAGVRGRFRSYLSDGQGNATLEFTALVVPLIFIIFTIAELGVFMTRTVMISRGTDIAMRDVRLGLAPSTGDIAADGRAMKERICQGAFLISDCVDSIQIEMRPLDEVTTFFGTGGIDPGAGLGVDCVDRLEETNPVVTYNPGQRGEIMFVRVCLVVNPLFPGVGYAARMLPTQNGEAYAIIAETAFMNEPS